MKYFLLTPSDKLLTPLKVIGLDTDYYKYDLQKKDFERLPKSLVSYFNTSAIYEVPAILAEPTIMVSTPLKKLLKLYDPEMEFKMIQLFSENLKEHIAEQYWVFQCSECDCVHEDSVILPDGEVKKLILDKDKIMEKPIFKLPGVMKNKILVSLPLAESILRRNWLGIGLSKVELR